GAAACSRAGRGNLSSRRPGRFPAVSRATIFGEMNRLAQAPSPYLLQHAENPVEWYEWGEEALERARADDKPILLSIGYAACHWGHLMAPGAFEGQEAAAVVNRAFRQPR